jgi:hypothetical protein
MTTVPTAHVVGQPSNRRAGRAALDLTDPAAVRRWVDDLADHVEDLGAAAEDQVAPPAERTLGRAKARELIRDARETLIALIALARAGLPPEGGAA